MQKYTILLSLIVILCSCPGLQAEVTLYVEKGPTGFENDVQLNWNPDFRGHVYYSLTPQNFSVLQSVVTPPYFHENALIDGEIYYYTIAAQGDLYSVEPIVGPLRYIPATGPGGFNQGSLDTEGCRDQNESRFVHVLTKAFIIMETEVTRQMWADLKLVKPWLPADPSDPALSVDMPHPVINSTWYEVTFFANLLSDYNGLTPCYYSDQTFTNPINASNYASGPFYCNFNANGYRLPTEGEWEWMARAGTTTVFSAPETNYSQATCAAPFCLPGEFAILEQYALYCSSGHYGSVPVGTLLPNLWNILDVHGNACEWVWDWYPTNPPYYPSGTVVDHKGATFGVQRMVRFGSFSSPARNIRSARRIPCVPNARIYDFGFRLCRTLQ